MKPLSTQRAIANRILVVDDILDNCYLLQVILEGEGFEVEIATSGRQALTQIRMAPPDLLLLDVMMPEMDGLEVVRRVRSQPHLPFIPIVLITGCDPQSLVKTLDVQPEGYVCKPIDCDELLHQVQSILSKTDTVVKRVESAEIRSLEN